MDWSGFSIPPMRHEARFGDRIVPAFAERPRNIWQMVADAAVSRPDGEALVAGEARLSWAETADRAAHLAAGFAGLGLRRGDRLALLLGNRIEIVIAMFAASRLGLITVVLSTRQQKPEITYALADSGTVAIVHEDALVDRLPEASEAPALRHRIAVDGDDFRALGAAAPDDAPATVGEEDTALILYTSGTTGRPKGAMLSHFNVIHSATVYMACMALTTPTARSPPCRCRTSPAWSPTS